MLAAFNSQLGSQTMGPGQVGFDLPGMKPSYGPIPPMKPHTQQIAEAAKDVNTRPYEFTFQQHFDEEGALYFLGSFGKKRLYQNPHTIG